MTVSFVIPCYQEEEALAALRPHLTELTADEIVFVDDGSRDGTGAALLALAAEEPRARIKTHPTNRGVGAAMRTGIRASTGDVVVVYDADRTYPLADAARLVAALGSEHDVAGATPFAGGGGLDGVPAGRSLLSRAAVLAYRLVLGRHGRHLTVYTCAFRAWRGSFVRDLAWRSDGFPAAAEQLGRALLLGGRAVEVPSTLRRRTEGTSKMRVLPTAWGHGLTLLRLLGMRLVGVGRPS